MEIMDELIQKWLAKNTSNINEYCNGLRLEPKEELTIKETELGNVSSIEVWKNLDYTNIIPKSQPTPPPVPPTGVSQYELIFDCIDDVHYNYASNSNHNHVGYISIDCGDSLGVYDDEGDEQTGMETVRCSGNPLIFIKDLDNNHYSGITVIGHQDISGDVVEVNLHDLYDECYNNCIEWNYVDACYEYTPNVEAILKRQDNPEWDFLRLRFVREYRLNSGETFNGFMLEALSDSNMCIRDYITITNGEVENNFNFTPSYYPHVGWVANRLIGSSSSEDNDYGRNVFVIKDMSDSSGGGIMINWRNALDTNKLGERFGVNEVYYRMADDNEEVYGSSSVISELMLNHTYTGNYQIDNIIQSVGISYAEGGYFSDRDEAIEQIYKDVSDNLLLDFRNGEIAPGVYRNPIELFNVFGIIGNRETYGPIISLEAWKQECDEGHPIPDVVMGICELGGNNAFSFSGMDWGEGSLTGEWKTTCYGSLVFRYSPKALVEAVGMDFCRIIDYYGTMGLYIDEFYLPEFIPGYGGVGPSTPEPPTLTWEGGYAEHEEAPVEEPGEDVVYEDVAEDTGTNVTILRLENGEDVEIETNVIINPEIIDEYTVGNRNSIIEVIIGSGVTVIDDETFISCKLLSSVEIPDSVTSIGGSAFAYCMSLDKIIYNGTTTQWDEIEKADDWNLEIPATVISCTDGEVELNIVK